MEKVLYIYGGPEFHPTKKAGEFLKDVLESDGRFVLEMTSNLDAFINLPDSKYETVVVYTTGFNDELTAEREKGLLKFIKNGGGFVGIHSAADSFKNNRKYIEMLGSEFKTHPKSHKFNVSIVDQGHYMTSRLDDYSVFDEMYHLKSYDPEKVNLLAETPWQGEKMPMAYTKEYGEGRVSYLANGHYLKVWENSAFQKLVIRAIAWTSGREKPNRTIKCGLLGYGPSFNMGKGHGNWINFTEGMKTVAVCDKNHERIEAAKKEMPDLDGYYTDLEEMLAMEDLDLVVNILPHNLHAPMTLKCLDAGKHVILEKPFCLTVKEANKMIDKAQKKGLMLSVFHNRRWDEDFLTIRDLIERDLIGDVFHIECAGVNYGHPGFWWRSDKEVSGGIMYDWGAHFLDWILLLVPSNIKQIMGDFQKRMWDSITNEDHGQVFIRFENGVTASYLNSNIAAVNRPKWQILGTKGSIEVKDNVVDLVSFTSGIRQESKIELTTSANKWAKYYGNIADHLLLGEELICKAEQDRRIIGIIETAQQSNEVGRSLPPQEGCK